MLACGRPEPSTDVKSAKLAMESQHEAQVRRPERIHHVIGQFGRGVDTTAGGVRHCRCASFVQAGMRS